MKTTKNKKVRVNRVVIEDIHGKEQSGIVPSESSSQLKQNFERKYRLYKVRVDPKGWAEVKIEPTSYDVDTATYSLIQEGKEIASYSKDDYASTQNDFKRDIKGTSLKFLDNTCAKQRMNLQVNLENERQESPHPEDHPEWLEDYY